MGPEIAWLAGLLEGEGYFALQERRPGRFYPVLRLSMTDEDVVRRAAVLMGTTKVHHIHPPSMRRKGWQPQHAVILHGDAAIAVMLQIYEYMGERRRGAIDSVLQRRSVNQETPCANEGCGNSFVARGGLKFYCSEECGYRARQAGKRLRSTH